MLGLLKRACPLITDVKVRRTLYLSQVKCQIENDPRESPEACYSLDTQN